MSADAAGNEGLLGTKTWNVTWTSPAASVGDIKLYMAGVVANNDDLVGGDSVYTYVSPSPVVVVPVELSSFVYDVVNENDIELKWGTSSETNNYGFEIERSIDGTNFEMIDFIKGNGTTSEESNYTYIDNSDIAGDYYYRIRQVDFDGTFEYSPVIRISMGAPHEFGLAQNYPNPFNPSTTISYQLPKSANVNIAVYNIQGIKIKTLVNESKSAGNYKAVWNGTNDSGIHVASGVYIYKITADNFTDIKKMIYVR